MASSRAPKIIGGYTLEKEIGAGRASVVYEARDPDGDRFAVKYIDVDSPETRRAADALLHEHEIARQFDHPNLRKSHRAIRKRSLFGLKWVALVLNFVDGWPLAVRPVESLPDICQVFAQVARGLNHMHRRGLVHADIKPQNILITSRLETSIIDFDQSCPAGTFKEKIQGTTDFLAPEQARGARITQHTDAYNLGATLYWYLMGHPAPTESPAASAHLGRPGGRLLAPHEEREDIPRPLSKLILDCLEKDPMRRPPSMKAIYDRLQMADQFITQHAHDADTPTAPDDDTGTDVDADAVTGP